MRDPNAKTDALTRVQRETFFFIRFYVIARGHPPTIRQMAARFKIRINAVHDRLKWIEKKGVHPGEPQRRPRDQDFEDADGSGRSLGRAMILFRTSP